VGNNPKKSLIGLVAALSFTFGAERAMKHGFAYGCDFVKFCYNKGLYGWVYDTKWPAEEVPKETEYKTCEFSTSDGRVYILGVPPVHEPRVSAALEIYNKRFDDKKLSDAEKKQSLENFLTAVYNADVADGLKDNKTNEAGVKTLCLFLEGKLEPGKVTYSAK
jgi:hypothetical protein